MKRGEKMDEKPVEGYKVLPTIVETCNTGDEKFNTQKTKYFQCNIHRLV